MDEQNIHKSDNKVCGFPVYNAVFARTLYKEGFNLIDFCKNFDERNRLQNSTVYFFEDNKKIRQRLNELIKEQQIKKRKDILQKGD